MKPLLSQEQLDRLALVVGEAEKSTSGEIKVMIVRRSTPAAALAPLLTLGFMTVSLTTLWFERFHIGWTAAEWWLFPALCVVCAAVAWPLSRWWRVQRLFIAPGQLAYAAQVRAELEFHRENLSQTVDRTGILLFLSVFERHAVVLADKGIASRLPPETWNEVIRLILSGARDAQWEAKLAEAIRLCGRHLSRHFPIKPGDTNEISNAVVLKD